MKDIVLLSNRPWKHIDYLTKLVKITGCKIEAFLFSKMYYDAYAVSEFQPDSYATYVIPELYEKLKKDYPQTEFRKVVTIEEIEEFYNRSNIVIIADMEPGNVLSYDFCEQKKSSEIIYYSAESSDTIRYVRNQFDSEKVLVPQHFIGGVLEYTDYSKLIAMVKKN